MTRIRTFEPANYRQHDELTWYPGTIAAIEDEDYGHGPALRLVIELDGEDRDVYAIATDKLTPKSKLTRWAKGIFGENALDDDIDIDEAIGMRIEAMFEYGENTSGEPDEKVKALRRTTTTSTSEQLEAPF